MLAHQRQRRGLPSGDFGAETGDLGFVISEEVVALVLQCHWISTLHLDDVRISQIGSPPMAFLRFSASRRRSNARRTAMSAPNFSDPMSWAARARDCAARSSW